MPFTFPPSTQARKQEEEAAMKCLQSRAQDNTAVPAFHYLPEVAAHAPVQIAPPLLIVQPNPSSVNWCFKEGSNAETVGRFKQALAEADAGIKTTTIMIAEADAEAKYLADCLAALL